MTFKIYIFSKNRKNDVFANSSLTFTHLLFTYHQSCWQFYSWEIISIWGSMPIISGDKRCHCLKLEISDFWIKLLIHVPEISHTVDWNTGTILHRELRVCVKSLFLTSRQYLWLWHAENKKQAHSKWLIYGIWIIVYKSSITKHIQRHIWLIVQFADWGVRITTYSWSILMFSLQLKPKIALHPMCAMYDLIALHCMCNGNLYKE